MRVVSYDDPKAFAAAVTKPLSARVLENNVFIGIAQRMAEQPVSDHTRAAVWDGERLVLAALMTPPFRLLLGDPDGKRLGVAELAASLATSHPDLPGVSAETPLAEAFEQAWYARKGGARRSAHERLLYRAREAIIPTHIAGEMRRTSPTDIARACEWETGFGRDVHLPAEEIVPSIIRTRVEYWMHHQALHEWVVAGEPVAQAAAIPIGSDGARVLGVYTPAHLRGRGFAQALTAALTKQVLARGRWCVLYTDAENEITNKIYPRVGYELLSPFVDIQFAR